MVFQMCSKKFVQNNSLFYCNRCNILLRVSSDKMVCSSCHKEVLVKDGIPLFSPNIYWGKIPEQELNAITAQIQKDGFHTFTPDLQKKLDFTYDEDRADWRLYIPLTKDSVVLDVGAGLGRISIPLARVCGRVIACDQSQARMAFLKQRAKTLNLTNIDVFVGDIYDLPLQNHSVDLIVMNGVLEWVGLTDKYKDPRVAQIKALEICKKLLKPGGRLYIGIENRWASTYLRATDHGGLLYTSYMPRFLADWYSRMRGKGAYRTYTYSKKGYEKLFRDSGFSIKPDFYLLFPGYNLPRVIVPYEQIYMFQYAIKTFKHSNNILKKILLSLMQVPIIVRVYRFFFFSFGIIVKHD